MTYTPEVNSCTMQRGIAWFSSGGLLLALEGAERFFGLIQSFDFLKTKAPAIYAVAINPTFQAAVLSCGIVLILVGIKKAREPEKMMPPAAILGDQNQIVRDNRETRVAGRDMYIVNDVPVAPTPVLPRRREPSLIDRGVTERPVHLPAFNENRNEWSDLEFSLSASETMRNLPRDQLGMSSRTWSSNLISIRALSLKTVGGSAMAIPARLRYGSNDRKRSILSWPASEKAIASRSANSGRESFVEMYPRRTSSSSPVIGD
jgi:hypothetical protein